MGMVSSILAVGSHMSPLDVGKLGNSRLGLPPRWRMEDGGRLGGDLVGQPVGLTHDWIVCAHTDV